MRRVAFVVAKAAEIFSCETAGAGLCPLEMDIGNLPEKQEEAADGPSEVRFSEFEALVGLSFRGVQLRSASLHPSQSESPAGGEVQGPRDVQHGFEWGVNIDLFLEPSSDLAFFPCINM